MQGAEYFYTAQHFLNGIGTEQVKIDIIELMAVFAFVTFGPFLSIPDRTDTP